MDNLRETFCRNKLLTQYSIQTPEKCAW